MGTAVTFIAGDRNSDVLFASTAGLIRALGVEIDWEVVGLGDRQVPEAALASLRATKLGLMAYHYDWHADHRAHPPIVELRKALGMFANIRPVRSLPGLATRHGDIDLVLVREITEDIYAHLEHESIPGVYESLKVTTRPACERIARYAFDFARQHGRKKVTIVHKANIMKRSDGLFLKVAREVGADYADIVTEDVIVDALCMKLVINPAKFDVLVAGNLYGDIVADLCAGLAGGASNAPSVNTSGAVDVFAAAKGEDLSAVGSDSGDPLLLWLPAEQLLRRLGRAAEADRLRAAISGALQDGVRTPGLGGTATTAMMTAAVAARL
jgi:isocitrate dehydrogenase (NAD+)